ncbi:MAG: hypothetical protein ACFFED_15985 [Candidatus Thorarchaeota archaeon]
MTGLIVVPRKGTDLIEGAFVIKSNGEMLYGVLYNDNGHVYDAPLPSHVRACVTLFTSRESTATGQPYILEQNDNQWVYVFFESFTILVLVSNDEDVTALSRKMVALGRHIAQNYGKIITIWHGSMSPIEGMDALVGNYINSDLLPSDAELVPTIEIMLDRALENSGLAYAGIIDASGRMLAGNIPKNHLANIWDELIHESVAPSTDIVPTTYDVLGYSVQVLRVQSLTVIGAPHKDGSKIGATTAVSEIAQSLSEVLN